MNLRVKRFLILFFYIYLCDSIYNGKRGPLMKLTNIIQEAKEETDIHRQYEVGDAFWSPMSSTARDKDNKR